MYKFTKYVSKNDFWTREATILFSYFVVFQERKMYLTYFLAMYEKYNVF